MPQSSHLSRSGLGHIIVHDRQVPVAVMLQLSEGTIQHCPNVLWSEGTDSRDGGPLPRRVTGWNLLFEGKWGIATHPLSNAQEPHSLLQGEATPAGGDSIDTASTPRISHPVTLLHTRNPSPLGGKDAIKDGGLCSMLRSKNGHVLQDTGGAAMLRPWTQQVSLQKCCPPLLEGLPSPEVPLG